MIKLPCPYNENIILVEEMPRNAYRPELKENQYYAVMVTDGTVSYKCKTVRPESDYFDIDRLWLGLECLGAKEDYHRVYVSKDYWRRFSHLRGTTFFVEVKDTGKCYILD